MATLSSEASGPRVLVAEPLTGDAFRAFGDVIERGSDDRPASEGHAINDGSAWRRHDLARVDAARGGHVAISTVRAQPRALPFRLQCLERHVRGSQALIPLDPVPWIVVVCAGDASPSLGALRAFVATAGQGVNYARATWHHPLIATRCASEFIVVDRIAEDGVDDCEIFGLEEFDFRVGVEQVP
jgi:ureidoglycolate lyase